MNRIQNKDHRIRTYEINKVSLSCFDDKTHIQNNGCDVLLEDSSLSLLNKLNQLIL